MDLLLIGGVSGSGKSVALGGARGLRLLRGQQPAAAAGRRDGRATSRARGRDRVAIALDVKTDAGPRRPAGRRSRACAAAGWNVRFLYLDAKTETLVKRFSETRRRHPFSSDARTLTEAIEYERALLADVRPLGLRVRHERPAGRGAARLDQGLRQRRRDAAHAAVRVVRLQARRAARRRPRLRRALPAESALRAGAAAAHRPRRAGRRVPREAARGRADVRRHLSLRRAAGFPTTRATTATT